VRDERLGHFHRPQNIEAENLLPIFKVRIPEAAEREAVARETSTAHRARRVEQHIDGCSFERHGQAIDGSVISHIERQQAYPLWVVCGKRDQVD
jgi:DNA repair exonuclease SbcCD nuclease subunit